MKYISYLGWLIATIAIAALAFQVGCKKQPACPSCPDCSGYEQTIVDLTGEIERLKVESIPAIPSVVKQKPVVIVKTTTVKDTSQLEKLRAEYEAQLSVYQANVEYYEGVLERLNTDSIPFISEVEQPAINYSAQDKGPGWTMDYEITGELKRFWYNIALDPVKKKENFLGASLGVGHNFSTNTFMLPAKITYGHKWWTISGGKDLLSPTYFVEPGVNIKF